jgi:hypothetical protein
VVFLTLFLRHLHFPLQLWPAAQVVNFRFVPPEQRILYVNGETPAKMGGGAGQDSLID